MFLGSFTTFFSGKNRLILPKRFRKGLGSSDSFYIILGENGEIWGFDVVNWENLITNILKSSPFSEEGRTNRLRLFPRAEECFLDNQGRFVLSQELVSKLDLKNEVLIIGAGDHFEIWDTRRWQRFISKLTEK